MVDTVSYAYADEAHNRIDTLENIVTRWGDNVTLTGAVTGSATVSMNGDITVHTVLASGAISSFSAGSVQDLVEMRTIGRTLIQNSEITLPSIAIGDIAFGYAQIFENLSDNVFFDVTCELSADKTKVLFDTDDLINNKYCVLSYLTYKG